MGSPLPYFSLLGLGEEASQDELEARYQELADYLSSSAIPPSLRDWAHRQATLVDEAYAVLADPEQRAAARLSQAPATAEATPSTSPERPRDRTERRASAKPGSARRPAAARPGQRGAGASALLLALRQQPFLLGGFIVLVIIGAVLLGRYGLPDGGGGEAAPAADQTDVLQTLDQERVAELMAAYQQDPSNLDTMFELGERFFEAGQWQNSIDWLTKLVAADPNNTYPNILFARTDIGTANYNLGRFPEAQAAWQAVLQIDPNYVQAHYNMGFLYATVEPVDLAAAKEEWQRVVELAPSSQDPNAANLANIAQQHLSGLPEENATEASPAATPEVTPGETPATSS